MICQQCSDTENIQRHHIDVNHKNNNPKNIQLLCSKCHVKLHRKLKGKSKPLKRTDCSRFIWKNPPFNSSAIISIRGIKEGDISLEDGEILIGRFDKTNGSLIMKPEKDFKL